MFGENSLIAKIAHGDVPEKKVKTVVGVFTIKYPTGKDFQAIAMKTALRFGGLPVESFEGEYRQIANRDATLSVAITVYPEGFPVEYQGDDITNFPLEEVKNSLYREFGTFYKDIQKRIQGNPDTNAGDQELGLTD